MVQEVLTMRYARNIMLVFFICLLPILAFAASDQRGLSVRPKAPTGEEVKGDLWLVAIGINSYISWPRLKTAVNDAKAVKETLLKRYHLDPARVVELTDEKATRKNILGAFRDLAKKVRPDDSLLVYYAGHGHIDSITGKGSWIPVESATDDPSAWISNRDITDYLNINAIKARHVLLVSDSCFSGDFFRGSRAGLPTINDAFLKRAYTRSSRQAISSGGLEPVSDAGFGGNSVFSHFLISTLNNNRNPYLIPSEIFSEIKAGVGKNANQLPQFGDLHGTGGQDGGELILFLKDAGDSKLKELGATSAARQKELEQLKKAEQEAAVAKQNEQQEIARKQGELDALDKQIAEMKSRMGSGTASSTDSLDSVVAMVEQKEAQARRLEELRTQRKTEEAKRQQDLERLRIETFDKRVSQIKTDLAKYQKVVSSQYGADMKTVAWDAMLTSYPEAKEVGVGDVDRFLVLLGLVQYNGDVITPEMKAVREKRGHEVELKRQGLIDDPQAGLQWVRAPDRGMDWNEADDYVKKLSFAGGGWRLPTMSELRSLYERFNSGNGLLGVEFGVGNSWVWSSDFCGSFLNARYSTYYSTKMDSRMSNCLLRDGGNGKGRVLAVRTKK